MKIKAAMSLQRAYGQWERLGLSRTPSTAWRIGGAEVRARPGASIFPAPNKVPIPDQVEHRSSRAITKVESRPKAAFFPS